MKFDFIREAHYENIERIVEAGRFTPTGSNRQNVRYVIIEKDIPFFENEALKSYKKLKQLSGILGK